MTQNLLMFHVKPLCIVVVLVGVFGSATAIAEVNKCVAPDGTVSYSDQPCPKSGSAKPSQITTNSPKDKVTAKMSAAEAHVAREAAGKEFMARYNESMTPECRKFASAMPDRQATNLSKAEQAGRDGFKERNCDQMVLPAQTWYADTLKKIETATDKPSARSQECKKWAETMATIFLNSPRNDAEVQQFKEASDKFTAQRCDQKQFDEATNTAMAPFKAIADRADACQAKRKRLETLRPQRAGMNEAGKKDMAILEKELLRECPEFK
jgi:Domain of unknown function (DUF4124)